jgi:SAM-dependent methyltransferase
MSVRAIWPMLAPMTSSASANEIRAAQRETWDTFAPGWEKWDDVVQGMLGPVGDEMVRSLEVGPDDHHLDVASGTGEPGLTVAAIATAGRVVLSDLSPVMLAAAGRRAVELGLEHVETRECSADALPFEDATFDSVTCRFGFMFFPDIAETAAELVRVLKPGGRLSASVWAGPEGNPWATIAGAAVATDVEVPPPPPDAPGMFRCAAPGMLSAAFEAAGLHDLKESDVPLAIATATPEDYWQLVTDCTAPVVAVLSQVDEATRRRITAAVVAGVRAQCGDGPVRLDGMARCVGGRR